MRSNPLLLNPQRKEGVEKRSINVIIVVDCQCHNIKGKQFKCQISCKNMFKYFLYSLQEEIIPLGMQTEIFAFSLVSHVALQHAVHLLVFRKSFSC